MTTNTNQQPQRVLSEDELRRQFVNALSEAQVMDVDAEGENVIEQQADRLLALFTQQLAVREREAEDRVHRIYKKEMDMQKRTIEAFMKREQLNAEPEPIVLQVNPKSHTYLTSPKETSDE